MSSDLLKDYQDPGTSPGVLRPAEGEAGPPRIVVSSFSPDGLDTKEVADVDSLRNLAADGLTHWIQVIGLGDVEVLGKLGEIFDLHPLALEDVVHLGQRPKVDDYEDLLFIVLQHLSWQEEQIIDRQVAIFVGERFVLTLHPSGLDLLQSIRERLARPKSRMRARGTGYLAYAIVDLVVDSSFPVLGAVGDHLEAIEDRIIAGAESEDLEALQDVRREVMHLRQILWPQREALARLAREDQELLIEDGRLYLRDCYDHAVQALESTETYREMASSLFDVYLSTLSQKLNDVMRVLTIISTVFIPLGFLAGVFGMNFDTSSPFNMPELHWRFGYMGFWVAAVALAVGMITYFRRKRWL